MRYTHQTTFSDHHEEHRTIAALRKELALADMKDPDVLVHREISPSQFIYQGLEIEDAQYVYSVIWYRGSQLTVFF